MQFQKAMYIYQVLALLLISITIELVVEVYALLLQLHVCSDWDMSEVLRYLGGPAGAVTIGAVTATAAAWYMMSGSAPQPNSPLNIQDQSRPVHVRRRLLQVSSDENSRLYHNLT